jgi:hypothetical protein
MSLIQKISAEPDFLHVKVSGSFSLREAKENFIQVLEILTRHKVQKVLLDGREVEGNPEVMERFFYGEFAAESLMQFLSKGVAAETCFAYVLHEPVLDPGRFGETVAVNRGMTLKVFDALEDALAWLQIEPAKFRDVGAGKKSR